MLARTSPLALPAFVFILAFSFPALQDTGTPEPQGSGSLHEDKSQKQKPLWSVDLKRFGFRTFKRGLVNDYGSRSSLAFTRESAAVLFNAEKKMPIYIDKEGRLTNPTEYRAAAVFFDPRTGNRQAEQSWPIRSFEFRVWPTAGGQFLFYLQEMSPEWKPIRSSCVLYSPQAGETRRLEFPLPELSRDEWWEAEMSPTGKTLLVTHTQGPKATYRFLDPDSLAPREEWIDEKSGWMVYASDSQILRRRDRQFLEVGASDTGWRLVGTVNGPARFLSDDTIIAANSERDRVRLEIINSVGETMRLHELRPPVKAKDRSGTVDSIATASNGKRFAVVVNWSKPAWYSEHVLLVNTWVFVWDIDEAEPIFAAELKWRGALGPEIALAPDGSLLGIVNEGKLTVYELPH